MRLFGLAVVALVVGAALAGCGDSEGSKGSTSDSDQPPVVFATYASTGASEQASGRGTLAVSNGCLVLSRGGEEQLIVLNDRSTLDGETLHVVDALGRTADMKVGDTVAFGGGYHSLSPDAAEVKVPNACSDVAKGEVFFAGSLDK